MFYAINQDRNELLLEILFLKKFDIILYSQANKWYFSDSIKITPSNNRYLIISDAEAAELLKITKTLNSIRLNQTIKICEITTAEIELLNKEDETFYNILELLEKLELLKPSLIADSPPEKSGFRIKEIVVETVA